MDMYGFYTGKIFNAYEEQGAHVTPQGTRFVTFAPAARNISVIGEFLNWQEIPMNRVYDGNFFECFIPEAREGMMYKYRIYRQDGSCVEHCDPYGFGMELRPNFASIIRDLNKYKFHDEKWMENRSVRKDEPLNIYEVHLGSWRTNEKNENGWYSYKEIGKKLIPYLKDNGYNYLEIMPLSEHPCDESWGYQNTGFFSPTSRYGTAEELMELVDDCHKAGIGVLMDFVPVHFAVDAYALANYDGTALYEYPNQDVGVSEWGSCNFIHSRGEVRSYLQSAANYWLKEYHFDGLRMDAISRIIYWQGDEARGVNGNAVDFIKYMNQGLKDMYPTCILAAEDSTNFPKVTKPVSDGGLGFDYKWDMGWMNDTLDYFKKTSLERVENYHKLTFSMMYYYDEDYLLPLSHDEVVHGKATIVQKMYGAYEEKFPQARAFYMYMFAHPGKKLNFMGNEIGQLREWDEKREQDWDILKYPIHDGFYQFMKKLQGWYQELPALSEWDYDRHGFEWIDCHQEERCIYAFERMSAQQKVIALFHFAEDDGVAYECVAEPGCSYEVILDSEWDVYGGEKKTPKKREVVKADGKGVIEVEFAGFEGIYLLKI
ncbi:MAG: 1,4-alpha-glucan branching protein GlgB [Lachnospiraceae bacterium]|nr:1,4-alpha-glucan branching protein GlgB [Lachnospiraceae bacterium]MDD3617193.1 1,4-alpha-glucan branching protein GlgB [Lachnospiraceae bacterium]